MKYPIYFRNDDRDAKDAKLMKLIKKSTKSFGKCSVEQTATLMAWSEKNGLDVAKFRTKVMKELEDNEDSD